MDQFPPNLDDGELYLHSDISLNQNIPTRFNPQHSRRYHLSYMDDLAHRVTALSLLRKTRLNTPLKIPHNLERFTPPVRPHAVNPLRPPSYYGHHGSLQVEVGQRPFPAPLCDIHFPKPTPTYRDMVVQRQQPNRLVQQNPVLPNQGSGFGFRGGFRRESGGTGVFHPRIINTSTITGSDAKKKQSVRDEEKTRKNEQRNSTKRWGVSKGDDCYYHLPPEMRLPRDWTY